MTASGFVSTITSLEELGVLDRALVRADLACRDLLPGGDPLVEAEDRRQRVGAVPLVPLTAGEVVDDGHLVATGREAHRRRPAEIAIAPENEDAHERRQSSAHGGASSCPRPTSRWAYSGAALTVLVLASFFPAGAHRAAHGGARLRRPADRVRDLAPSFAIERRRAAGDLRRSRPGDRLRHRAARQAALGLRLREGQRRPDPRPRGLRHRDPVPARPPGADRERADEPAAFSPARGARLGGVPRGAPAGALPRTRSRW